MDFDNTKKRIDCAKSHNSIDALRVITPQEKTNNEKTFVNFVGELPYDAYLNGSYIIRILLHCKPLNKKLVKYF